MFETFIQTNSTKQNPFGSLNLNYQGEGISAWLLSSIAISIIFLTTIHNPHHQSGCNLQLWICHLQFINCNLHFSNCDLQFKNCNWLFTICKRYIFIATSLPRHKPGGSLIFYFHHPAFKTDQNLRNFDVLKISYFSFLFASLVLPHPHLLLHFELLKMTQPTYSDPLPFNALPIPNQSLTF